MAVVIHQPSDPTVSTTAVKSTSTSINSLNCNCNKHNFEFQEESEQFLYFVQNLLVKYRMYNKSDDSVVSGGLQQFIIRRSKLKAVQAQGGSGSAFSISSISSRLRALYDKDEEITLNSTESSDENCLIQYLPVDLKLYIFSFLDAKSLCMASCVNKEWNDLACDDLLWKCLLDQDISHWNQISYLSNPQMYLDVDSDWSNKEIYLQCSPDFKTLAHQSNSAFHHVSSMLKSLLPKKVPKVAMFGPGLEQTTSGLVRNMLYVDNTIFTRTAMFPGQDGIGGGITLKLQSGHSLHLSVLYSASRSERENRGAGERLQGNRMLQAQAAQQGNCDHDAEEEEDTMLYGLTPQVQHFCQTVDAFIYVIDSSQDKEIVSLARKELILMMKGRRSSPHIPILILSCVKQAGDKRIPACEIVQLLHLSEMPYPWLVTDCESESLQSVDSGVVWLVNQAQYK